VTFTRTMFHLPRPRRLYQYIKARVVPPGIDAETAAAVLDPYGLTLRRGPYNLPLGGRNRTVLVHTSAGKMVLKRYRRHWQATTIRHEHSILTGLEQVNFPAPRLVTTTEGESLVSQDDAHYGLFDYVSGVNYAATYLLQSRRRQLLHVAGETLARLHQRLEGFVPTGHHHLGFVSYSEARPRDLDWYMAQLDRLPHQSFAVNEAEERAYVDWLAQNRDLIRVKLLQIDEKLASVQLPRRIIHGDFGIHNLLFQSDGTAVVHDFELARLEWRLYDLIITLSRMKVENRSGFLTAYQNAYPLSRDEWHFLPQVWQAYVQQGAVRAWHNYFVLGDGRRLCSAYRRVNQADWALINRERLLTVQRECQT